MPSFSKALAFLAVAPAIEGFRERRSEDCYSKYDGKMLVKLAPCNVAQLNQAMNLMESGDCRVLSEDELKLPSGGGCADALSVCTAQVGFSIDGNIGEIMDKDAGQFFRMTSGNVERFSEGMTRLGGQSSFYNNWRDLSAREARVERAVSAAGGMVTLEKVGESLEGRDMKVARFRGSGYVSGGPRVVITSNIHAREWIAGMAGVYAVEMLAEKVVADPSYLNGTEVAILYMANPDGFVESTTTDRMQRKNMRKNSGFWCRNGQGVDLNRNFDVAWGTASSGSCGRDDFHGPSPMSEPETNVIADLMKEAPMSVYIDIHAYSELILSSWGYTTANHPRMAEFKDLGMRMKAAVDGKHGRSYTFGPGAQLLYAASGGTDDYATNLGALGFTYELRPGGNGVGGFAPPANQILPAAEECFEGLLVAIDYAKTA